LRVVIAAAPKQLSRTDITEHPTAEGRVNLRPARDACSMWIVGYSIDRRITSALAVTALRNAPSLLSPYPPV
jgi:hypothetical protein